MSSTDPNTKKDPEKLCIHERPFCIDGRSTKNYAIRNVSWRGKYALCLTALVQFARDRWPCKTKQFKPARTSNVEQ